MMEAQKDTNGLEIDKKSNGVTEKDTTKVPENGNSTQGPPKPTKSSNPPTQQNSASLENGTKSKAEEAEESGFAINTGYFRSWQAALKVLKMVCFIAMIASVCVPISGISKLPNIPQLRRIWSRMPALEYGLAISVIGLMMELSLFVIYLLSFNRTIGRYFRPLPIVVLACHLVMWVFVVVAPIVFNAKDVTGAAITSFVAFDMFTIAGYTLELYFNMVWFNGGPELACLPFF